VKAKTLSATDLALRVTPLQPAAAAGNDDDDDDDRQKIDWHDYTQIARDEQRTGMSHH